MTRRAGFTLFELMVGLAVIGLVLLVAHAILSEAAASGARLGAEAERLAARGRAVEWLRGAVGSLQVGQAEDDSFDGFSDSVAFSSRLETALGWSELRRVGLAVSGRRLLARLDGGDSVVLADSVVGLQVQYLLTTGAESEWLRGWRSPATAPLALRLIVGRAGSGPPRADTLLLRVGPRS